VKSIDAQLAAAYGTISKAAPSTDIPAATWQPLLDALANRSTPAALRQAVKQLHVDVDAYLAAATEQ
jgi:hypothetical protein